MSSIYEDLQTITSAMESKPDFTVTVGQQKFEVHKSLLMASSEFFKALFDSQMIETQTHSTEMETMAKTFVRLMKLCYNRMTEKEWYSLTIQELIESLITADKYEFKKCNRQLSEQIVFILEKSINKLMSCKCNNKWQNKSETTVWDVLEMAVNYNLQVLQDLCLDLCDRFDQYVYETSKNSLINEDVMMKVLLRPKFSEYEAMETFDEWAEKVKRCKTIYPEKEEEMRRKLENVDRDEKCTKKHNYGGKSIMEREDKLLTLEDKCEKSTNSVSVGVNNNDDCDSIEFNLCHLVTMPFVEGLAERDHPTNHDDIQWDTAYDHDSFNCKYPPNKITRLVNSYGYEDSVHFHDLDISTLNKQLLEANQSRGPTDLTIIIGEFGFNVHKSVLISSSYYFRDMFANEANPRHELVVDNIAIECLAMILSLCYKLRITGEMWKNMNGIEIIKYIMTAKSFGFVECERLLSNKLMPRCRESHLRSTRLESKSLWQILEQATMSRLDYLYELGLKFMERNPMYSVYTFNHQNISERVMIDVLTRQTSLGKVIHWLLNSWFDRNSSTLTSDDIERIKCNIKQRWPQMEEYETHYICKLNEWERYLLQSNCQLCEPMTHQSMIIEDLWPSNVYYSVFDQYNEREKEEGDPWEGDRWDFGED